MKLCNMKIIVMTIKILSRELINQISAGEVVQRPSSVVKELLENSFDAGASNIKIDIEKGGIELIRIKDDGYGIDKTDLKLALTSYATSKISSLEDLEKIKSLGFRGEALASISSISKLTLTSRTLSSDQAWQIYTEGRNYLPLLKPAAHPCGTTLEVVNLFYNTPARKKFLCSEKTEFIHIDKIVRSLALSHFKTSIILNHNGKLIRQYKYHNRNGTLQNEKRLSMIYGNNFIKNSLYLNYSSQDLKLCGWILDLCGTANSRLRYQCELQYCYVNKRMIKNRLINIAIRRAFQSYRKASINPRFIIFLDINPNTIDINVHPTKKDIRFYNARLVHDFIYHSIINALESTNDKRDKDIKISVLNNKTLDVDNYLISNNEIDYQNKSNINQVIQNSKLEDINLANNTNIKHQKNDINIKAIHCFASYKNYKCILERNDLTNTNNEFKNILMIIRNSFALLEHFQGLALISLPLAQKLFNQYQLNEQTRQIHIKPFIIPIHIKIHENIKLIIENNQTILKSIGCDIKYINGYIVAYKISFFCQIDKLPNLIKDIIKYISYKEISVSKLINWLLEHNDLQIYNWNIINTIKLLKKINNFYPKLLHDASEKLLKIINIDELIKFF